MALFPILRCLRRRGILLIRDSEYAERYNDHTRQLNR